jgi:hypothetical protein
MHTTDNNIQLTRLLQQQELLHQQFRQAFNRDYEFALFPATLQNWDEMSYTEFRDEIAHLTRTRILSSCMLHDWYELFCIYTQKAQKLRHDLREITST